MSEVELKISTRPSKFFGYQSKARDKGTIKLFVSEMWNATQDEDKFVDQLIYTYLAERICIERAFNKLRMKNRCKPECKINPIVYKMLDHVGE